MKKTKNIHIDPTDEYSTMLDRAVMCCNGFHQTIAGAILRSPQWQQWKEEVSRRMGIEPLKGVWDVDECEMCDAMSSEHFQSFLSFCQNMAKNKSKNISEKRK